MILDLPKSDRPRERLLRLGAKALSSVELLAIILGEGTRGKSALHLSAEIISYFRTLEALEKASVEEISVFQGIGVAKAVKIKAALELSRQLLAMPKPGKIYYSSTPEDIFAYVKEDFIGKQVEILMIVYLDSRLRVFQKEIIGIGTLNALLVEPREVFYHAIKKRADQFILVHNHPSGDSSPSEEDIRTSKNLFQMSCMMGCVMKDHLIIAGDSYSSIKDYFLL
jgi:DNA repair protein RadC